MRKCILLIGISLNISNLYSQITYSKEVEAQIIEVENNLGGDILIEGQKPYNLQERMAFFKVKGLSIAVVQDYKILWAKGYGWADEEEKRPVTTETLFEPGSISKSLNSMGILKLVQDKKLDLHTDINSYLKSWKFPYDALSGNKKITLAHLLSHTAGLSVHGFPGYNRFSKIPSLPQILNGKSPANTPAVRSEFEPGLKYKYSGGGTTISQLILNDFTQMPYDEWMFENVFKPLGMENSFFTQPPPVNKQNLLATGYREDGTVVDDKFHVYPEQGAAGLWTTPSDLCKYIIETQLALQGKSAKVLNQEMTKLRLTPYLDKSAGLGVFIEDRSGEKYFQHGAGNEGFRGFYYGSFEGGNGVAVFVNSDNGSIMFELMNSVAKVYHWKGYYNPSIKKEIAVPDSISSKYIGVYQYDNDFSIILKKEDGYYFFSNGVYGKMHFTSEKDFFNLEFRAEKQMLFNSESKVSGYLRTVNGTEFPKAIKIQNIQNLKGTEDFFNTVGWSFLENKYFDESEQYLKRGLILYPNSLVMKGNLAHVYLFKNEYNSAFKIYKENLNKSFSKETSFKNMILQDFTYFSNIKFDKSKMIQVLEELKLDIPKELKTN